MREHVERRCCRFDFLGVDVEQGGAVSLQAFLK
jgi:hypothetical protein